MRSLDRQVLHRVPHLFSVESLDHECLPGLSSVAGILWLGIPLVEQIDPDFRAAEMRFSVAQSQPAAHTILRRPIQRTTDEHYIVPLTGIGFMKISEVVGASDSNCVSFECKASPYQRDARFLAY